MIIGCFGQKMKSAFRLINTCSTQSSSVNSLKTSAVQIHKVLSAALQPVCHPELFSSSNLLFLFPSTLFILLSMLPDSPPFKMSPAVNLCTANTYGDWPAHTVCVRKSKPSCAETTRVLWRSEHLTDWLLHAGMQPLWRTALSTSSSSSSQMESSQTWLWPKKPSWM